MREAVKKNEKVKKVEKNEKSRNFRYFLLLKHWRKKAKKRGREGVPYGK